MASPRLTGPALRVDHVGCRHAAEAGSDAIREQLDRILTSPVFRNSRRNSSLLRHVVERALEGRTEELKERNIGIDVFSRAADYDTNSDHVVRSVAGEVRRRLAQYYMEPGRESEARIDLVAGSYVPQFRLPPEKHSLAPTAPALPVTEALRLAHTGDAMREYYRYLNCGYRLPLVGGTDKMSSAVPVGLYRTYARLDEEFSYAAWCRAVRSGRTFLSGGPLVSLAVDGREPGDTVGLSGPGTVSVRAAVRSIFPLSSLQVVRNGEVVARADANGGRQAEIIEELPIDGNSWIACRAFGAGFHLDEWGRRVFAHTSPVYLACGGDWTMTDPEGIRYIRTLVEGAREYVRHTAVRRSDQLTTHHHGEADHLAWLERPFAEALRALEERGRR